MAFTAHGNPMNALGGNAFADFLPSWRRRFPRPNAILCVSAHWQRRRMAVGSVERPETIHDFWGFPDPLYRLRYPAPGSPELARSAQSLVTRSGRECDLDASRGLDHGAWAPLLHLYPEADVPVVQLSLPLDGRLPELVEIGRALAPLRDEGILILGSGNLVHNLYAADLSRRDLPVPDWATGFDAWVEASLRSWDLTALSAPHDSAMNGPLAHPTLEHYAPILVCCGAAGARPAVLFPFEGFEHGTISMRCVEMR